MKKDYENPNLWILMFEKNGIYTETLYDSLLDGTDDDTTHGEGSDFDDFLNL